MARSFKGSAAPECAVSPVTTTVLSRLDRFALRCSLLLRWTSQCVLAAKATAPKRSRRRWRSWQVTGEEPVDEDDRDEEEEAPVRPSASQVIETIGVARLFFSFEGGEDDALRHVRALENKVTAIAFKEKKQKVITDYFRQ